MVATRSPSGSRSGAHRARPVASMPRPAVLPASTVLPAPTVLPVLTVLTVLAALTVLVASTAFAAADDPLRDKPVIWYEEGRLPTPPQEERDPNLLWDMIHDSVVLPIGRHTRPDRLVRRIGTIFGGEHVPPAVNVNPLDEVPNSTWFTNRIGLYPMTPAEVEHGAPPGRGPETEGPWTVKSAKTEGVSPGFVIEDRRGDRYLIKFDPPGALGMTTRAGVVSARILHAAGYHVPNDNVVTFLPETLRLDEDVRIKLEDGSKRPMTVEDLDLILARVDPLPDGRYLAIASQYIAGRPVGCYSFHGRRESDPNDRIDHQHRREQRGLRVFAAWLNHYDTKQHNTLDAYVRREGSDSYYLRHYLIDFASTLGTGAAGNVPRYGWEYTIDLLPVLGRTFALGLHEDPWRRLADPEPGSEVGYWESERFDPQDFKPMQPNSAFANMTHRDAYWAAKIVSAFADDHLAAAVRAAEYRDPAEEAYVIRILRERRDAIARAYFDKIPPLDFFVVSGEDLCFRDLGVERGIYPASGTRYRARVRGVDAGRQGPEWPPWQELPLPRIAVEAQDLPFWAVEVQVDHGDGWSRTTRVYVSQARGEVIALER